MHFSTLALCGLMLMASNDKPWWVAARVSWGIALFEYLLQVPANRIGYRELSLPQLKIRSPSACSCPSPCST
jgi:uncharacterized protein (DUF486 family)